MSSVPMVQEEFTHPQTAYEAPLKPLICTSSMNRSSLPMRPRETEADVTRLAMQRLLLVAPARAPGFLRRHLGTATTV
jgi:hypothetical protein